MRNHLHFHPFVRMMLVVNTLQQPSRTMMLHLVKIPLLMVLLTGLFFFFFFQFFLRASWHGSVGCDSHCKRKVLYVKSIPYNFRQDSPTFVFTSLAFTIFLFVFLWVQRCNIHYLFVFFCFSPFPLLTVIFSLLNLDFRSIYQISPPFPSLPETFLSSSVCLPLFFHLSFSVALISVYIYRVFFFSELFFGHCYCS